MKIPNEQYEVEVIDESDFGSSPREHSRPSIQEYQLGEDFQNASRYCIVVNGSDGFINSCTILANGGTTTVHASSAVVIGDNLFIAIGNIICCLEIPSLALRWQQKVDTATCFGIYASPDGKGVISHGEIDIAKISFSGEIMWSASGKDIFSEGFQLFPDHIETIDFNHEKYHVEISSGKISLGNGG